MDPKIIDALLRELYQYVIVGGIIILLGMLLKGFISTLATNIWAKIISRSKITLPDTQVYMEGHWWKIKSCGFNRVRFARPNKKEDGSIDEEAPEIITEMPMASYWKDKITYR